MRYFILFLLSFVLSACGEKKVAVEKAATDLIPAAKMEKILYDMQLADVYSLSVRGDTTEHFGQKNQDSLSRYYNEIFAHHGVKYDGFMKTMQWYKEHPAQLDTIYNNILNRMSAEEERYKVLHPQPAPPAQPAPGQPGI